MPKRDSPPRAGRKTGRTPPSISTPEQRARVSDVQPSGADVSAGSVRAQALGLAAKVEQLEAELAVARTRMAELELRADVDPLTEVLNRRGFDRELRRALAYVGRYGARAALVFLDFDRFKPINDRYGHAVGDLVLRTIAGALQHKVRGSDVVARLGGDEFAVLLWNLDEPQARAKAAALENVVAETVIEHAGTCLSVGASAGVAMLEAQVEPAMLLARADAAMYRRKAARRSAAQTAV